MVKKTGFVHTIHSRGIFYHFLSWRSCVVCPLGQSITPASSSIPPSCWSSWPYERAVPWLFLEGLLKFDTLYVAQVSLADFPVDHGAATELNSYVEELHIHTLPHRIWQVKVLLLLFLLDILEATIRNSWAYVMLSECLVFGSSVLLEMAIQFVIIFIALLKTLWREIIFFSLVVYGIQFIVAYYIPCLVQFKLFQ